MADPTVAALYRYPVKGLSPERMRETALTVGEAVPFDRAYAIENGPGPFNAAAPRHLPKITFLCLMRDERLARMQTSFDCATHTLVITQNGAVVARGDLRTRDGRAVIESFMTREMAAELRGDPRVVSAPGHCFSDVREKCLHIVNLASVRALKQSMGCAINPLRFRPNVMNEGLGAWSELDLLDREIALGGATLKVFKRTVRCAATNVDPETSARDMELPDALSHMLGHRDFGVYAMVVAGGIVREGDPVRTGH